jgi:cephalosporin hydroxylase
MPESRPTPVAPPPGIVKTEGTRIEAGAPSADSDSGSGTEARPINASAPSGIRALRSLRGRAGCLYLGDLSTWNRAMLLRKLAYKANRVVRRWLPMRWKASAPNPALARALGGIGANSDIHDHLGTLFYETVIAHPRLIVELGTRGGLSTRALLAAAEETNAHLLSVDIEDCSSVDVPLPLKARWTFIRADDVAFAAKPFELFCAQRALAPLADVIFIDTSHEYQHTKAELAAWLPRLAQGGVMLFHDTNMGRGWYRSLDGKVAPGGIGTRGVIQAIEELLGRQYDENTFFTDAVGDFALRHVPWSSGFLVLRRVRAQARAPETRTG